MEGRHGGNTIGRQEENEEGSKGDSAEAETPNCQ